MQPFSFLGLELFQRSKADLKMLADAVAVEVPGRPICRGSILDADPPAQGVNIAGQMTIREADSSRTSGHVRFVPHKLTWYAYFKQRSYSRLLRWAKYFSYSARDITPPSCSTRARSLAGNEACISSTRFQGASGVSHVARGTYSDGLVFV
jgi:hypothetical protein